ncbi:hypothetical protein DFH06DRAFT_1346187 [Mycena polygramma]|nr:hypothetical protein DFH06DRAFT_1346187 [Mycena polygramma]
MARNDARNDLIKSRRDLSNRGVPSRTFTTQLEEGRLEEALGDIGLSAITTARVFDQNRSISKRRPTTGPPEDEDIGEVHETRDLTLRALEKRIAALEIALDTALAKNGARNHRIAVGATVIPVRATTASPITGVATNTHTQVSRVWAEGGSLDTTRYMRRSGYSPGQKEDP